MVAYRDGDKEDPSEGSSPEHSILELVLRGASPDVLSISEKGAIPMPVNLCGNLSGSSIGMSVSSYCIQGNFQMSNFRITAKWNISNGFIFEFPAHPPREKLRCPLTH